MNLESKTVVITGASSGIGKAIAKLFLSKGANVIVLSLNKPDFECTFIQTDVGQEFQIQSAIDQIDHIDILINNAGIAGESEVRETSTELLNQIMDVNFKGTFWTSKYTIPKLTDGSCIINIGSICGVDSCATASVYGASKAAIHEFSKTLAIELAPKTRVNCIAPGVIDTEIWTKMYGSESQKVLDEEAENIPLKRIGRPEDIAHTALYLAENNFVNGAVIIVDGGQLAR